MRLIATGTLTFGLLAGFVANSPASADTGPARTAIEEVSKAYRNAPTLTDTITLDLDGDQTMLRLRFDKDNKRVQFDVPGFAVMVIDGELLVTSEAASNKYMKADIDGTITNTLVSVFGSPESIPFHFVMRENLGVDAYLNALTLGFLQNPEISGFIRAGGADQDDHVLMLSDGHGDARVYIDPATNLIRKVHTELPPVSGMGGENVEVVVTTDPVLAEDLSEPIAFDPGNRQQVDSPDKLVPRMIEAGDPAPDFSLPNMDGEEVSLSSLRGNLIVIDFWATWCVPCIRALPEVERFAAWVAEEGLPVKVYAVNVMEHRGNTLEERKEIAGEFWQERGFELENLMDYDDAFINELGINSIPTTLIIDGQGKVYDVHVGYSPQMFDMLKHTVQKAIDAGAAGE